MSQVEQQQTTAVVPFKEIDELKTKAAEYIPKLKRAHEVSVHEMQDWKDGGDLQDDEEREDLNSFLATIRERGQKMQTMRKELTSVLDAKISELISYEKPLLDDKKGLYGELRDMLTRYDQKKLEEKQRIEREAEQRRIRDLARVEIKAQILRNLTTYAATKAKNAESWSKAYFEKSTLEDWDKRADDYMKMRPNIKREEFEELFTINYADKLKQAQFGVGDLRAWIVELQKVETYEKWNKEVLDACAPVLNEWRAKIPDMKAERIRINNIKDEQARQQAIAEQRAKEEEDEKRRNSEIEQQALHKSLQIDADKQLDTLEASFTEQATVQGVADAGPTKLELKFTDLPRAYKPFVTIIYHVMSSKEFQGFQKKDPKLGTPLVDKNGKPEYIPQVQWWIDQFLKYCDANVPDTVVTKVAKTIVRK